MSDFKSQVAVKKFIANELVKRGVFEYSWSDFQSVRVGQHVRVFYAVGKQVRFVDLNHTLYYLKEEYVLEAVTYIEKDINDL